LGATDARERVIADGQFGGGASTWSPTNWFLALSTTTPATDGSGFTEPVGGSYARPSITNNATNFPAASTSSGTTTKTNGTTFAFANPTGNWGLITYFGFFTAITGGTPEYWFKLDANITVQSGNTPVQFDAGGLIMTFGATS
jgi:hypothetical protein